MIAQLNIFTKIEEQKALIKEKRQQQKKKVSGGKVNRANFLIRLLKKKAKYRHKTIKDTSIINELLSTIKKGYNLKLISNKFDSPSIIYAISEKYKIRNIYISTWAITDRGLSSVHDISRLGASVFILLDVTHSYKWVFSSGAYDALKDTVNFKFTENHSKFILIETECGKRMSFVGSMNLSNNPRLENIDISFEEDDFLFYRNFMMMIFDGDEKEKQKEK